MRPTIGTITWQYKPHIERIVVVPPTWPQDLCSMLVGDYKLAGCIPFVPSYDDRDDLCGLYMLGGP